MWVCGTDGECNECLGEAGMGMTTMFRDTKLSNAYAYSLIG